MASTDQVELEMRTPYPREAHPQQQPEPPITPTHHPHRAAVPSLSEADPSTYAERPVR